MREPTETSSFTFDLSLRLTQITAIDDDHYVVLLTDPDGNDRTYEFTVKHGGGIEIIQGCDRFDAEVSSFGYSHLIPKAVSAVHQARKHSVGRPAEARRDQ